MLMFDDDFNDDDLLTVTNFYMQFGNDIGDECMYVK